MASLRLRAATGADVDRLVDINRDAFADGPITLCMCPPASPQFRPFWHARLLRQVLDPAVDCMVAEDAATGAVVAFGIWTGPGGADADAAPPVDPDTHIDPATLPSDGDPATAAAVLQDLAAHHHHFMADPATGRPRAHWYLGLLATDPAHQGRGAAGRLLRWGAARADAAGVPCYLDATPAGYPVYVSAGHGYREVGRAAYLGGTHEQVFMVREAGAASA